MTERGSDRRFQFSLRAMLAATATVCLGTYLLFVAPSIVSIPAIFITATALPTVLVSAIVYGRGALRAFGIGALVPTFGLSMGLMSYVIQYVELVPTHPLSAWLDFCDRLAPRIRPWVVACWSMGFVSGLISVGIRASLLRRKV